MLELSKRISRARGCEAVLIPIQFPAELILGKFGKLGTLMGVFTNSFFLFKTKLLTKLEKHQSEDVPTSG